MIYYWILTTASCSPKYCPRPLYGLVGEVQELESGLQRRGNIEMSLCVELN
jgi:hypothetical protein